MSGRITSHVVHGDPEDMLWISESMRRCATCRDPLPLAMFFYRRSDDRVTSDCRKCIAEFKRAKQIDRDVEGTEQLGTALATVGGRKALLDASPKSSELAKGLYREMGGQARVERLVGRTLKRGIKHEDVRIGIKATSTFLNFITHSEKNSEGEVDLSTLSEQDKMMILFPVARKLLLDDPGFRKFLFTDADVRAVLLEDPEVRKELLVDLAHPVVIEVNDE